MILTYRLTACKKFLPIKIVAVFRGIHVSPAKHSYAWLPRKCDRHTDRQTDKVIPMCRYASQATQKFAGDTKNNVIFYSNLLAEIATRKRHEILSVLGDEVNTDRQTERGNKIHTDLFAELVTQKRQHHEILPVLGDVILTCLPNWLQGNANTTRSSPYLVTWYWPVCRTGYRETPTPRDPPRTWWYWPVCRTGYKETPTPRDPPRTWWRHTDLFAPAPRDPPRTWWRHTDLFAELVTGKRQHHEILPVLGDVIQTCLPNWLQGNANTTRSSPYLVILTCLPNWLQGNANTTRSSPYLVTSYWPVCRTGYMETPTPRDPPRTWWRHTDLFAELVTRKRQHHEILPVFGHEVVHGGHLLLGRVSQRGRVFHQHNFSFIRHKIIHTTGIVAIFCPSNLYLKRYWLGVCHSWFICIGLLELRGMRSKRELQNLKLLSTVGFNPRPLA